MGEGCFSPRNCAPITAMFMTSKNVELIFKFAVNTTEQSQRGQFSQFC